MHELIKAAVEQRMAQARAATPGDWVIGRTTELDWGPIVHGEPNTRYFAAGQEWPQTVQVHGTHVCVTGPGGGMVADSARTRYRLANATFIAANDPPRIIRDCQRDLKVLARHNREPGVLSAWVCRRCRPVRRGPCAELLDLAEAYGIEEAPNDGS